MTFNKMTQKVLGAIVLPLLMVGVAAAEGPSLSGFVDFGYNYNFNGQTANMLRSFDQKANSFTLQNAEVVVSGKSDKDISYRVDVNYGYDASLIHSAGFTSASNLQVDIQQAYISALCPLTGGNFTFGKFVTLHGAEVIEAKDNYNISRGLLFNYAIPLTHTGIKWDKGFMDNKLTTVVGLVNGWDNLQDNNKGKTVHGMVSYAPSSKVALTVGGTHGPEQTAVAGLPSVEKNARSVVDTILKVVPMDKLTIILNHDWGVEEGLAPAGTDTTQNWAGLAGYVNYAFTDTFSGGFRWETFDDEGSRTGTEQVLNSATFTVQHTMNSVISRLEYRQDGSSKKSFVDDQGMPDDSQSTIAFQVIFPF
jgi:hypothetical protein